MKKIYQRPMVECFVLDSLELLSAMSEAETGNMGVDTDEEYDAEEALAPRRAYGFDLWDYE